MSEALLVLEGIVTTLAADRSVNIAPMGPLVDRGITRLRLRPYQSSQTYRNLKCHGEGVFHVTDDVQLIARYAVGLVEPTPSLRPAAAIEGRILTDSCRWYAFEVVSLDDREARTTIECRIVDQGRERDFFGFNRAKHAVVEAAILATRVQWMPRAEIAGRLSDLAVWVEKTGGDQERQAFAFLQDYIQRQEDRRDEAAPIAN